MSDLDPWDNGDFCNAKRDLTWQKNEPNCTKGTVETLSRRDFTKHEGQRGAYEPFAEPMNGNSFFQ